MLENSSHTLTEFIDASVELSIVVEGLPSRMAAGAAASLLRKRRDIQLKPLSGTSGYFHGWFDDNGHEVRMLDGDKLLFTIFAPTFKDGFRLRLEQEALKLLSEEGKPKDCE